MIDRETQGASVRSILSGLKARQRRVRALTYGLRGLFYGLLAAIGVATFSLAFGSNPYAPSELIEHLWLALATVALGGLAGTAIGLVWRTDRLRLARALDLAAASADRFASAIELAEHHRQERVRLLTGDALDRVAHVRARSAIPLRLPAEVKWLPAPALALVAVLWLANGARLEAQPAVAEIGPEQWANLEESFRRQIEEFAKRPDEHAIVERLEQLAAKLSEHPAKKEALAEIAKLRAELERQRQSLQTNSISMRKAAQAMQPSPALRQFADDLKSGEYKKAANELESLAERLKSGDLVLTAQDLEAAARDFERLAQELADHDELCSACRDSANAASKLDSNQLAESLKQCASVLRQNADELRRCDSLCKSCELLSELERRLAEAKKACSACGGNKPGNCSACAAAGSNAFVKRNDAKGGLKAGWGTAANWTGGRLTDQKDQRLPTLVDARENSGVSTAFPVISTNEEANSSLNYREVYADMVRKAEADLALEEVPVAYREFLRRYFLAIRPQEQSGERPDQGD